MILEVASLPGCYKTRPKITHSDAPNRWSIAFVVNYEDRRPYGVEGTREQSENGTASCIREGQAQLTSTEDVHHPFQVVGHYRKAYLRLCSAHAAQ
jgi:hypothetical protein